MRAIILAANRGSPMGEPGQQRPACLTPLAGKPIIERQIAALRGGGADQIAVVRGYQAEMIDTPGITCFENPRWADTGMVTSLAAAAEWLRSTTVIVSYANIFYLRDLVHRLEAARGSLMIAYDRQWRDLWARRFADPLSHAGTFRRSGAGTLLEIGGEPANLAEIEGQPIGLIKITPTAWQAINSLLAELDPQTRDRLDLTELLQRLLAAKTVGIGTVGSDGQWGTIESPSDVALYERMAAAGELVLET